MSPSQENPNRIDRDICWAWFLAVASAAVWLLVIVLEICGGFPGDYRPKELSDLSAWSLIDVGILFGLGLGVYRRSRICSVLLTLCAVLAVLEATVKGERRAAVQLFYLVFFFRGTVAVFRYHKLQRRLPRMRLPSYKRPYCKTCGTVWSAQNIGRVLECSYGHRLVLKSFNPWLRLVYACGFLAAVIATMAIPHVPVFWFGGILLAPVYVFNGFRQWHQIRKQDSGSSVSRSLSLAAQFRELLGKARRVVSARTLGTDVLLCGGCGQKLRVPTMSRTVRVTCPRCRRQTVLAPKTYSRAAGAKWFNITISDNRALAYLAGGAGLALFLIICIFVGAGGKDPNQKAQTRQREDSATRSVSSGLEWSPVRRNPDLTDDFPESALTKSARNAIAALRNGKVPVNAKSVAAFERGEHDARNAIAALKQRGVPVNADSVAAEIAGAESQAQRDAKSPAADLPVTTIPINNQIIFDAYPDSATRGQLTVSNGTDHHAIAKLIDIEADRKVLSLAICARQQSTIYRITDGTYRLIFAFGDRVYVGTDQFESPSGFSKFDNPLSFATTHMADADYYYTNYTKLSVTLHAVVGGNAKTTSIPRSEFERY
jgi:hypothetical protein